MHTYWLKLGMSFLLVLLFFFSLEGVLRFSNFSFTPREKVIYKPWVAMRFGTEIDHYPTQFDPPGYIWRMPPDRIHPDDVKTVAFCWPDSKKDGKIRIAFLGGSTTQPDGLRDYPRRCIKLLNDVAGTNRYEAINCGMSSYTTHQSLIALKRYALPRDPDVVVVYHGWNDLVAHQNGHSDREIDRLMRIKAALRQPALRTAILKKVRTAQMVAWIVQGLDVGGPHVRVSPDRFMQNYQRMASLCADKQIPMIIVERPADQHAKQHEYGALTRLHYSKPPTDSKDLYGHIHSIATQIQHAAATDISHVQLAPVAARLRAEQMKLDKHPVRGVTLFKPDHVHLTALGNQYVAETIAGIAAPDLAIRIRAYMKTARYWTDLAASFRQMDEPFACHYAVVQAGQRPGADHLRLQKIREWAEREFEFAEFYEKNRWGNGLTRSLDERLEGLAKCRQLRPYDFGVIQQIFQVCHYMGQTERAYPYMQTFLPQTPQDEYKWLLLYVEAAWAAQQYSQAKEIAIKLLTINPGDPETRGMLNDLIRAGF